MQKAYSPSYRHAHLAFLNAAAENGYASLGSYPAGLRGPSMEPLVCSVVGKRTPGARIAVVTSSAVHGVEGHPGSMLQSEWMFALKTEKPIDIIHVHAVNPYGFAWDHRGDQNNVDINRNFVNEAKTNRGYVLLAPLIHPRKVTLASKAVSVAAMLAFGQRRMQEIIQKGQYTHPKGLFFGGDFSKGDGISWSRKTWERIVAQNLSGYEHVVHVDLHTGLGARGQMKVLSNGSAGDNEFKDMQHLWPLENVQALKDKAPDSVSADVTGDITDSWSILGNRGRQRIVSCAFEFGVTSILPTFFALQQDRAAFARGEIMDDVAGEANTSMRNAFAPMHDPVWVNDISANGRKAMESLLQNLTP